MDVNYGKHPVIGAILYNSVLNMDDQTFPLITMFHMHIHMNFLIYIIYVNAAAQCQQSQLIPSHHDPFSTVILMYHSKFIRIS